jgi:hypothetical protein
MTHNPNRFAGFAVAEVDHDGVLAGFVAEEVDRVVFFVGAVVEGGDQQVGAVVYAEDGLALVVTEVEAVNVVAAEDHSLSVDRRGLVFDGFGEADDELFEVDGAFAGFGGTILYALLATVMNHGKGEEGE